MSDRFARRPEIVRPYQYRQGDVEEDRVPEWLCNRGDFSTSLSWVNDCGVRQPSRVCINGGGCPEDGDWVVEDVFGKLSKMLDYHFRVLYEPVETSDETQQTETQPPVPGA